MRKKAIRPAMMPRPTTPPTTPPAIAPALDVLDAPLDVSAGLEPPPLPTEVGLLLIPGAVGDTVEDTVEDTVAVGLEEPVALVAGAVSSFLAVVTLKMSSATTSRYAQAGIDVPDGICSGYAEMDVLVQLVCQVLHVSISLLP